MTKQHRTLPKLSAPLLITLASAIIVLPIAGGWLQQVLQFDRDAIRNGEIWRLVTGHLTHWTFDQFFWDTVTFAFLAPLCAFRSQKRFLTTIGISSLLISATVWICHPEIVFYRGLSGIDSALFALLAVSILKESLADRDWPYFIIGCGLTAGFLGKTVFELATGSTLFVDSQAVNTLCVAHVVGVLVGAGIGLLCVKPEEIRCIKNSSETSSRCACSTLVARALARSELAKKRAKARATNTSFAAGGRGKTWQR
jgi:rhomboid family GlyGly-CTERM serine protease